MKVERKTKKDGMYSYESLVLKNAEDLRSPEYLALRAERTRLEKLDAYLADIRETAEAERTAAWAKLRDLGVAHPEWHSTIVLPEKDRNLRQQSEHLSRRLSDLEDLLRLLERLDKLAGDARDIALINIGIAAHKAFHARPNEPDTLDHRLFADGRKTEGPKKGNLSRRKNTADGEALFGPQYQTALVKVIGTNPRISHTEAARFVAEHYRNATGKKFHHLKRVLKLTTDPRKTR